MAGNEDTVPAAAKSVGRREIKRCDECAQQFGVDAMFCPFDGTKLSAASWDPTGDALLGTTIDGRYQVKRVLGEGGMGTVYEVRHKTLGRAFAMKVLRRDIAKDAELARRFIQEAKATAAVKHPHIVSITDFGSLDDGTPFFVMELLVGTTLAHALRSLGSIPASRAAKLTAQIAGGLGAAHEAGVVHRDLKPDNVFLVARNDGEEGEDDVRIVDFGAAKIVGAGRLTKTGIVFGTPHYMAPEQASGQPVDQRADIYALGVIMYEMFTGRVPFEADTYMGVLTQHLFVDPTPPSVLRPELGEKLGALEAVTLRALAKKPEDRYPTMQALAAEVHSIVRVRADGTTEIAPRPPATPRKTTSVLDADPFVPEAPAGVPAPSRAIPVLVGCLLGIGVASAAALAFRHEARGSAAAVAPAPVTPPYVAAPVPVLPPSGEVPPTTPPSPVGVPPEGPASGSVASLSSPGPVLDKKLPPVPAPIAKARPTPTPAPATATPARHPALGGDIPDPWDNK